VCQSRVLIDGGCRVHQHLLFQDEAVPVASVARCALPRRRLRRQRHAREPLQGLPKVETIVAHQEVDDIAMGLAAEAEVVAVALVHQETRGMIVVEWTAGSVTAGPGRAQRYTCRAHHERQRMRPLERGDIKRGCGEYGHVKPRFLHTDV